MKIVILSQFYSPEPVPLPADLAAGLQERGHQVLVVTGFPNYPHGEIYPGVRQRGRVRQKVDGVDVVRVRIYPNHSTSGIGRIFNYLSFTFSALRAGKFVRGADAVYVYGTPMTAGYPAWWWRKRYRVPYLLQVQDLWPESVTGSGLVGSQGAKTRAIGKVISLALKPLYRSASGVQGIAPTMAKLLGERTGQPQKVDFTYNWSTQPQATAHTTRELTGKPLQLVYAGNLGDLQDLHAVIDAVAQFTPEEVQLRIAGQGILADELKAKVHECQISHIEFLGQLSGSELEELYAQAHFQLVTLKDLPIFHGTVPSKFQASISRSLPVITTVQGDVSALVSTHNLGFTANCEDPDALAAAIRQATLVDPTGYRELTENCWRIYAELMSRDQAIDSLETKLRRIAEEKE